MRTTLTLDDDVAALLARHCQQHRLSLKAAVNDATRQGLRPAAKPAKSKPFRTKPLTTGRLLVPGLDNIADVPESVEGP